MAKVINSKSEYANIMNMLRKVIKSFFYFLGFKLVKVKKSAGLDFPVEISNSEVKLIENASRYSMTGTLRMWALLNAIKYVNANNIHGDIVECGVWRGGNLILAAQALDESKRSRKVWGYDTFSGMTEPTIFDTHLDGTHVSHKLIKSVKDEKRENIHAVASKDLVLSHLRKNLVDQLVKLVEGPVEETLLNEQNLPKSISVLRLDTDWYQSTKAELEILYPRLAQGGVLIIDDYGHYSGARKAVDEYFGSQKPWMQYVDYSCRLIIKN